MRKILTSFAAAMAMSAVALPAQAATSTPIPHSTSSHSVGHYNTVRHSPDPRGYRYGVIGDSYSTGVGGGGASGRCRKGPHSFANILAAESKLPCWGNNTPQVLHDQVHRLPRGLTAVSSTNGGNDLNFIKVMSTCSVGDNRACKNALGNARHVLATGVIRSRTVALWSEVRREEPGAKRLQIGYPHLVMNKNCAAAHFSSGTLAAFNTMTDQLNAQLASAARATGTRFIDVRSLFNGHAACSARPYINAMGQGDPTGYMHPTAAGYAAEANLLRRYL